MAFLPPQLPSEVWTHVFGHLSTADKFSVRASYAAKVHEPQQLTHLCICDVKFPSTSMDSLLSAVSQFTNLTSLLCHHMGISEECGWMIQSILTCLPRLKHLSLSTVASLYAPHSRHQPGPIGAAPGVPALSSLELIDYEDGLLPEDVMKLVPHLHTLAVFYKHSHQQLAELRCDLRAWLSDLTGLSTLVIVKGPPVQEYVCSLPATVTKLVLCVVGISSEDLAAVAAQLPNLLHLHIDPWPSHLGALTAKIPQLFPQLRSLNLRHEHVPEKDFLCLHKMKELKSLEVLDNRPRLSELTSKLRTLTNYRLSVKTSPGQRDLLACSCVCQVY
ncbi:uncharacterized protein ACBR49_015238 [Aulostomus maculatus]